MRKRVIALTAGLTLVLAAPGLASVTSNVNVNTGKDHGPGQARAAGSIVFKTANQLTLDLRVDDICPGDSRYAHLEISYADANGVPYARDVVEDRRGCDATDGVPYHYDVQNAPIDQIILTLSEREADGTVRDVASRSFDNPYR